MDNTDQPISDILQKKNIGKPIYRSYPIFIHHISLSPAFSQPFLNPFQQEAFSCHSPLNIHLFLFFLFWSAFFLCCCFVFVIFIRVRTCRSPPHGCFFFFLVSVRTDMQYITQRCMPVRTVCLHVCLCGQTHLRIHNVLKCIRPHTHGCISILISLTAPGVHETETRKQLVHLKHILAWKKNDLKEMYEMGKPRPFHLSGCFIHWSAGKD